MHIIPAVGFWLGALIFYALTRVLSRAFRFSDPSATEQPSNPYQADDNGFVAFGVCMCWLLCFVMVILGVLALFGKVHG